MHRGEELKGARVCLWAGPGRAGPGTNEQTSKPRLAFRRGQDKQAQAEAAAPPCIA